MNEVDWLAGADPIAMLAYLEGKVSDRKLRLFACACVRRAWPILKFAPQRNAVETAERFAEDRTGSMELQQARERAEQHVMEIAGAPWYEEFAWAAAAACCLDDAAEAARTVCESMRQQAVRDAISEVALWENEAQVNATATTSEPGAQAGLLREVFGNVFRPASFDPGWLRWGDGAVVAMAREISDEGRFDELPYLGDALEDAGCAEGAILRHCRGPGGHVRGCWVLDLIHPQYR